MNESRKTSSDPPPVERVRTKEPQAPFGQDEPNPNVVSDATADEKAAGEPVEPGAGGYYPGRDPEDDMPALPSVPETQEDPRDPDSAPKTDSEPPASH